MRIATAILDETFERTATTPFAATDGCALRSTNGDREKSGAKETQTETENNRVASAMSADCLPRETQCSKKGDVLKSERGYKVKNPAAVALGRLGGKANTPAQNAARARNAKLGGRPKKPKRRKPNGRSEP